MEDFDNDPLDLLDHDGDDGDGVIEMSLLEEEEKLKKGGSNKNSGCCVVFLLLSSSLIIARRVYFSQCMLRNRYNADDNYDGIPPK